MIGGLGRDFSTISKDGPIDDYRNLGVLSVRAVKMYADGALGSRGAALIEPYADERKHLGLLMSEPPALEAMVHAALERGYQVNIHAIGDRGNRVALDAFEKAFAQLGDDARRLRNRIEHAQVVSLDDIPRFKSLQIIASMQPTHATSDMNMAEDRVGPRRIKGAYAWRRFLEQGTIVAGGSDFPVESANPFYGIHAAVTRQDHNNNPVGGWFVDQAMTIEEAIRAFTLDAAYAEHGEKVLGTLEEGKLADFIFVDQDPFEVKPSELWKTKVLSTYLSGRRVY
jgi:predicted amidohydrolase YtcJ